MISALVYYIMDAAENKNLPGLLLLIDFQKAFDYLSWKFLYKTSAFFASDKQFINWIKLFNNDIIMNVLQSGYLSEGFRVGRGCRQGDPTSPYLFFFGADILALLILINPEIVGFKLKSCMYKRTHFGDDSTLILDGSVSSLQAACNTFEIFGNFYLLIWIGVNQNFDFLE